MLAIRNDCTRPDVNIPWSFDFIKINQDLSLKPVLESYLKFEELTSDLTHGWQQTIIRSDDLSHIYYLDIFGPHVTMESIEHVNLLYRTKYEREFARPWYHWAIGYRNSHNITLERSIVQISNPNVGSNSSALPSYPL